MARRRKEGEGWQRGPPAEGEGGVARQRRERDGSAARQRRERGVWRACGGRGMVARPANWEERASGAGMNASQYRDAGLQFALGCGQVKQMSCGIRSRFRFAILVTSKLRYWCLRIPIPDSKLQCQLPNGALLNCACFIDHC